MSEKDEINTTTCPLGTDRCPIFDEVTLLKKEVRKLQDQVRTDHLTGLFNNRHLHYTLEQEIERTKRSQQPTTFILLDIDHFKKVNDDHGHVIGDQVLIHLANIVKNTVRKIDIPCRYGGEEFAIILPSTPLLTGVQVAERVRSTIESNEMHIENVSLKITASLGVDAFFHNSNETPEAFISRVDAQLYTAKDSGRNTVSHAVHSIKSSAEVSENEKEMLFNLLDDKEEK